VFHEVWNLEISKRGIILLLIFGEKRDCIWQLFGGAKSRTRFESLHGLEIEREK
jgi:hypothetical protein